MATVLIGYPVEFPLLLSFLGASQSVVFLFLASYFSWHHYLSFLFLLQLHIGDGLTVVNRRSQRINGLSQPLTTVQIEEMDTPIHVLIIDADSEDQRFVVKYINYAKTSTNLLIWQS
jgi:hypothetical protein